MNLLLYFSLICVNFILAFTGRITANPHKNIILETTFPANKLEEPQIRTTSKEYKKRLLQLASIFSLIALPLLLIPYDSITMLYFFLLLFGFIAAGYYLQISYIRKMATIKRENQWILTTQPLLVDTKLIINKNQKLLSLYWFLPTGILTILGILLNFKITGASTNFWIVTIVSCLSFSLFLFFYYLISRLPVKPLTDNQQLNQQSNDLMRHYWSVLIILSSLIITPISFLVPLSLTLSYQVSIVSTYAYLLFIFLFVAFTFGYLFSMRKKQDHLIAQSETYRYSDEDHYWRYAIYMNPEDNRTFINDRIGMNLTINLGKKRGKFIALVTFFILFFTLCTATIPLLLNDFSTDPFQLTIKKDELYLSAPFTKTQKIPMSSVESIKLIDSLPKNILRVNGTATDNYLTGHFLLDGKDAYLLIDKKNTPILEIKTKEKNYYYTAKNKEETRKLMEKIE